MWFFDGSLCIRWGRKLQIIPEKWGRLSRSTPSARTCDGKFNHAADFDRIALKTLLALHLNKIGAITNVLHRSVEIAGDSGPFGLEDVIGENFRFCLNAETIFS